VWQIKDFKFNETVSVAGKGVTEAFFGCVAVKGLTCKTRGKVKSVAEQAAVGFTGFTSYKCKKQGRIISRWTGLFGIKGKEQPMIWVRIDCQRAKRERSSRFAGKALREWRIADVLSTGREDK